MKRFLLTILLIAAGIAGAYVLFAVFLFVRSGFGEGTGRELEFPGVRVLATVEMRPWCILSKKDIPTAIYISVQGKYLKLDSETTRDDAKKWLDDTDLDYKEQVDTTMQHKGRVYFRISAGCLHLFYCNDKLWSYDISFDGNDSKIMDGVCIGTSPQTLFPLPLGVADIEAMFGRNYEVYKVGRFK